MTIITTAHWGINLSSFSIMLEEGTLGITKQKTKNIMQRNNLRNDRHTFDISLTYEISRFRIYREYT